MKRKTRQKKMEFLLVWILALILLWGNSALAAGAEARDGTYYGWQTVDEILDLCGQGVDLKEFFKYTIWGFLTREDLETFRDQGRTLEDVYAQMPMTLDLGDSRTAGFSGSVSSSLGNIPALGNGSHGPIWKINLSGETAFCARFGAACRSGMVYSSVPLDEIGIDGEGARIIRGLLAQYAEAQSIYDGPANYIMTQAGIWLVQNGRWSGDAGGMAAEIAPLFSKTPDCPSVEFAADYFRAIVQWIDAPENAAKIANTGLEAWANGPNQYLVTATGEGEPVVEEPRGFAHVEIEKTDSETGKVIAHDAQFVIYEWNGSSFEESGIPIRREGNLYSSDDLTYSDENQGKFCVEEVKAPADGNRTGYYGDLGENGKRRYEVQVEDSMRGEAIRIGNHGSSFTNERVVGSVTLKKVDVEADAYLTGEVSHGIAELDGAVYDLYAKEPIVHPDGVTGTLYEKDELVGSGVIRDGSCSFENLYLGSYYVKERQKGETLPDGKKLSYAEGYLLDETEYPALLSYEGESVRQVHREVRSNKEQVIKAKAVFEKVQSDADRESPVYLQGAGFTIYRVDLLTKRDSFVRKGDGSYEEESIRKAYLAKGGAHGTQRYDFSGEEKALATVYLRDTDLREDTAWYWQDGQKDIQKGKLKPLGNNRYQVAELFSDGNGQVTTPYLPYGQYLAVETTVPKDHVQSKPFLLTFSRERTGTPVTVGITEETPRGYSFLKEEGELIKSMEAVYFSGTIDNEPVKQQLLLCKKDADTGKEVLLADVKFKIAKVDERTGKKTYLKHTAFYPGADSPEIFCTNGKGYLQLPMQLSVGTYVIEEVEGPQGFYNEGAKGYVTFRVTMDRDYQAVPGRNGEDVLLITETYFNRETKGVLTIRKQGEVLANYKEETLLQKVKAVLGMETRKQFVYEELPLAGAEYTIRAAEDIKTQDRQGTIRFKKGETVAVLTTGENGQAELELPLGSYEIEETKAPYGYTRTEEIRQVTFTWEHQFQEFITHSCTITNARAKAKIGICKKIEGTGQPLEGVTFGLYTVHPIYTREGKKLLDAGELLGTCMTGADGKGTFDVDVPIGNYEIRELSVPDGIFLDETPIPVVFEHQDDKTELVVIEAEQWNADSEVFISKRDLNGEELKGAELTVAEDWSGKTVETWISDGTGKELRGLTMNEELTGDARTYTLTERTAPEGYQKAESIRFCLVKEGEKKNSVYVYDTSDAAWKKASDQTVVMKDREEPVPVQPSKQTPIPAPATGDSSHPGFWMLLTFAILYSLKMFRSNFRANK